MQNSISYTCRTCGVVSTPEKRVIFLTPTFCLACDMGEPVSAAGSEWLLNKLGRPFVAFENAADDA